MEHIQRHKFYLARERNSEIGIEEAAASWFDNIYLPMVTLINTNNIMKIFPHRTETDFYIWISKYKNKLFQDVFVMDEAQNVIDSYAKIFSNPLRKILGKLRKYLGLVKY